MEMDASYLRPVIIQNIRVYINFYLQKKGLFNSSSALLSERMKSFISYKYAVIAIVGLASCNESKYSDIIQKRDHEIDVRDMIVKFDEDPVMIGASAYLATSQNKIYIEDSGSTDKLVNVYDATDGKYLGSFADYGSGPYEIGVSDLPTVIPANSQHGDRYIMIDHAQHNIFVYDVDSALVFPDYLPQRIRKMDGLEFPSRYKPLNDSTGLSNRIRLKPDSYDINQTLVRYNLSTGDISVFTEDDNQPSGLFSFTVVPERNLVAASEPDRDIIWLYDLDGNVKKRIKGPEFTSEPNKQMSYNTLMGCTDKYLLTVYCGKPTREQHNGNKLIVNDFDGNYIATLNIGEPIIYMKYHAPTGKLYMVLKDDRQFVTLDINKALEKE